MKKKFSFISASIAKKFAKDISEGYSDRKATISGNDVVVTSDYDKENSLDTPPEIEDISARMRDFQNYMYDEINIIHRAMEATQEGIYNLFWNHEQGHLPPISDASKMQSALQALGLGDSFEVRKPVISVASNSSGVKTLTVE